MNIESIIEKIGSFNERVVESGFKRDVTDWLTTLSQPEVQSNIITLRDIAEKTLSGLDEIGAAGVKDSMTQILPNEETFADLESQEELRELLADPDVDVSSFHSRLNNILTTLSSRLGTDTNELKDRLELLTPYSSADDASRLAGDKALISVIFKDIETITRLKKFSRTLDRWNQVLQMYHQLVKSDSPEEIELVEVQNGSIDVIINVDISLSLGLIAALTAGYKSFNAYLKYKTSKQEIIESFAGNKKLIAGENQQEALLLDNIKLAVRYTLEAQHKLAKKGNPKINKESPNVKLDRVSGLLTEHIIRGNEVKLLSASADEVAEDDEIKASDELSELMRQVRTLRKSLGESELKLLMTRYEVPDESPTGRA